jgi:hypothetical protein
MRPPCGEATERADPYPVGAEFIDVPLRMIDQPLEVRTIPYLEVPTELIWEVRDPKRWNEILREDLAGLRVSMRSLGQLEPVVLVVNRQGIRLREGHHRLRVAMDEGWETLKTRLVGRNQ